MLSGGTSNERERDAAPVSESTGTSPRFWWCTHLIARRAHGIRGIRDGGVLMSHVLKHSRKGGRANGYVLRAGGVCC